MSVPDHRVDRRGRAQGGARLLPRGGAGARGDALADWSTACCCPRRKNGLLAAVLLGVGRAVGETMAVLMATGHAVQHPPQHLRPGAHPDRHHRRRAGRGVAWARDHYQVLFLIGVLLFAITFVVNLTADLVRARDPAEVDARCFTETPLGPPQAAPRAHRASGVFGGDGAARWSCRWCSSSATSSSRRARRCRWDFLSPAATRRA